MDVLINGSDRWMVLWMYGCMDELVMEKKKSTR